MVSLSLYGLVLIKLPAGTVLDIRPANLHCITFSIHYASIKLKFCLFWALRMIMKENSEPAPCILNHYLFLAHVGSEKRGLKQLVNKSIKNYVMQLFMSHWYLVWGQYSCLVSCVSVVRSVLQFKFLNLMFCLISCGQSTPSRSRLMFWVLPNLAKILSSLFSSSLNLIQKH